MILIHHSKLLYDERSKTFIGMRINPQYNGDPPREVYIKGKSSTYVFNHSEIQSVLCDIYMRQHEPYVQYTLELYGDMHDVDTRWDMLRSR